MKKFIGILLTMAVAVANQAIVRADHNYGPYSNKIGTAFSSNTGSAYTPEQRYHTGLSHRSIDRQSSHDQAHSLGLDNRQHNSLHQSISHGAFHDNQEHASFDYNLSSSIRTSEYGNLPYSRNYMSRTRSSSNPYSISPSNGIRHSGIPTTIPRRTCREALTALTQPRPTERRAAGIMEMVHTPRFLNGNGNACEALTIHV
jgi:hypothetical protein